MVDEATGQPSPGSGARKRRKRKRTEKKAEEERKGVVMESPAKKVHWNGGLSRNTVCSKGSSVGQSLSDRNTF